MQVSFPTSDKARLDTLDKVLLLSAQAGPSDHPNLPDEGTVSGQTTVLPTVPLPEDLNHLVKQCRATIYGFVHESKTIQQNLKEDRAIRDMHLSKVRSGLRSYWKALTLYVETHPQAANPLAFYGLVDGGIGRYSAMQVLRAGQQILRGVDTAESRGFPVLTLGASQESFATAITQLAKVMGRLALAANLRTQRKQDKAEARVTCYNVMRKVTAYLRYSYLDFDPIDVRAKMRSYGINFKNDSQGTQSADAVNETQTQTTDEKQTTTGENQTDVNEIQQAVESSAVATRS